MSNWLLPPPWRLDLCTQGQHCFSPTWEVGHLLCTVCGRQAVCPLCVPQMPDTKQQLVLCAKHRPKEVEP